MSTQRNFGFRGANGSAMQQGRGFGAQDQQQQGGFYQQQQQPSYRDEEPYAWLNLSIMGTGNERKKLGKGIPLREGHPLERAIIDLFFDADGKPTDFDPAQLLNALVIDVRAAGSPDEEFTIDLFGASKAGEAPAPKSAARRTPKADAAPAGEADAPEEQAPAAPARKRRPTL